MSWLTGYGQAPPRAPSEESAIVVCPSCGGDNVRIRASDGGMSYLECGACRHGAVGRTMWKSASVLRRVLISSVRL